MLKILRSVIDTMIKENDIDGLFKDGISEDEFFAQIVFELAVYFLSKNGEKKSIKFWVENLLEGDENDYQQFKRVMKYSKYYKEIQKNQLKDRIDVTNIPELNLNDMQDIDARKEGYYLDEFQFRQLRNMKDIILLKKIVDKRIVDIKKVSNVKFKEMYNELDEYLDSLKTANNNIELLKNMTDAYKIEVSYGTNLIYKIVLALEESGLQPTSNLQCLLKLRYDFFSAENRFICQRHRYIQTVLKNPILCESKEMLRLVGILFLKKQIIDAFLINQELGFDLEEAADYLAKNYKIFEINEKKVWTNKRIRIARAVIDILFMNVKNPVFRT